MNTFKRVMALAAAGAVCLAGFAGCGNKSDADKTNADVSNSASSSVSSITQAKTIQDLKGMKIGAQTGTFHADALNQIPDVKAEILPDFSDLLNALTTGAIDGYIAEEPTAFSVTEQDSSLTFLPFKNNDTGFTATDSDVSVSIGVKKGSDLLAKVNEVLAGITDEQKSQLMEQIVTLSNGGTVDKFALESETPANPTGTLKVGMECNYKPYNWTDNTETFGAVPISSEGQEGLYANGYDVQVAKYVANKLGLKLEVYAMEFDSLITAVNAGTIDAIVAGMSPTEERKKEIDFSTPYYISNLVVIVKK